MNKLILALLVGCICIVTFGACVNTPAEKQSSNRGGDKEEQLTREAYAIPNGQSVPYSFGIFQFIYRRDQHGNWITSTCSFEGYGQIVVQDRIGMVTKLGQTGEGYGGRIVARINLATVYPPPIASSDSIFCDRNDLIILQAYQFMTSVERARMGLEERADWMEWARKHQKAREETAQNMFNKEVDKIFGY